MKKTTGFSFHTEATKPVTAYGLTVASTTGEVVGVGGGRSRIGGRRGRGGEVSGGSRWCVVGGVVDDGDRGGGLSWCSVESAFEVEA